SVGCASLADEVSFKAQSFPPILNAFLPPGAPPFPNYPSCLSVLAGGGLVFTGHVNVRTPFGLTPLGGAAITSLMKRGMIVDIHHMSDRAANRTIARASAVPGGGYPLMSGHTGIRDRSGFGAETSRSTGQLARLACLGGMFGLGTSGKNGTRAIDWAAQY